MTISRGTAGMNKESDPSVDVSEYCRHLVSHYEACLLKFGDSHRGVDWPNEADAHKRYAVMLDVIRAPLAPTGEPKPSLLDFGCGASHLYQHLLGNGRATALDYCGVDLSDKFIELSRTKFPHLRYVRADLLQEPGAIPVCDYVVANGVFTERCALSFDQMLDLFRKLIAALFQKARIGLAFNVMSTQVDWQRADLFHVPFDLMANVLATCASRNFVFRQDYGLYEYSVYVYR